MLRIFFSLILGMVSWAEDREMAAYEESFELLIREVSVPVRFLDRLNAEQKDWLLEGMKTDEARQDFLGFVETMPPFIPVWKTIRSYTAPNRNKVSHQANLANAASSVSTSALERQWEWLNENSEHLNRIYEDTSVNKELLAAIYYAETKLSVYALPHLLYEVLFTQIAFLQNGRLSNESGQMKRLQRLKNLARASLHSLYVYAQRSGDDVQTLRSSWAGAVGPMQLMPFNFQFLRDGDGDGVVRAASEKDSLHGAANFLKAKGFNQSISEGFIAGVGDEEVLKILLKYNASQPYAQGVLHSARLLQARGREKGANP